MKKKHPGWLPKISYRTNLLIGFLFMSTLPALIIGLLSYRTSVDAFETEARAAALQSLQQTGNNITEKINQGDTVSNMIFSNEELRNKLTSSVKSRYAQVVDAWSITSYLENIQMNTDIYRIRFYTKNDLLYADDKVYFYPYSELDFTQIEGLEESFDAWKLKWTSAYSLYDRTFEGKERYVISAFRGLVDDSFSRELVVVYFVDIQVNSLYLDILEMKEQYPTRTVKIVDDRGRIVCSTDSTDRWGETCSYELPIKSERDGTMISEDTLMFSRELNPMKWTLVLTLPYSDIRESGLVIRDMTMNTTLFAMLFAIVLSSVLSASYSKKIRMLIQSMERYVLSFHKKSTGDDKIIVEKIGKIEELAMTFEWLKEQLDHLVINVYETQLKENRANLKALQEQVKPHFLYNILGSIKSSLDTGQARRASDLIVTLADFYRIALSNDEDVIPIVEEVEMIRKYVRLQYTLYPDIFDFDTDIDTDIESFLIVRFSLQPLVENAIKYAFMPGEKKGLLRIVGKMEGNDITISVCDNGLGMSDEKISEVRGSLVDSPGSGRMGYGLRNVNARLKLRYGPGYGLTIESALGFGTEVRITIPPDF